VFGDGVATVGAREFNVTYGGTVTHHHHLHGLGLLGLYCLVLGLLLLLSASLTLAARQWRGAEGPPGPIRGQERVAKPQLKVGAVLTLAGAVCLLVWWVALR
jgi:hypothetical protein